RVGAPANTEAAVGDVRGLPGSTVPIAPRPSELTCLRKWNSWSASTRRGREGFRHYLGRITIPYSFSPLFVDSTAGQSDAKRQKADPKQDATLGSSPNAHLLGCDSAAPA